MKTNLQKILIFFLLFIGSFSINAQTGNTCADAITIYHSDTATANQYYFSTNEKWLEFIATNDTMVYNSHCFDRLLNISLYTGNCNSLALISQSTDYTISNFSLNIGQKYYIKMQIDTINVTIDAKLKSTHYPMDCSNSTFTSCNKIFNNSFMPNATPNYTNGVDYSIFNYNIPGWGCNSPVGLMEIGGEYVAKLGIAGTCG